MVSTTSNGPLRALWLGLVLLSSTHTPACAKRKNNDIGVGASTYFFSICILIFSQPHAQSEEVFHPARDPPTWMLTLEVLPLTPWVHIHAVFPTALHNVSKAGKVKAVIQLLKLKPEDLSSRDAYGKTPLMAAAKHAEVTKVLLEVSIANPSRFAVRWQCDTGECLVAGFD